MANFDDIFSDDELLSNEELLRYVDDKTSAEDKQAIEQKLPAHPFEMDALEGLQQVKHTDTLPKQVEQLNEKLNLQLKTKKQHKAKRKIKDMQWIILAVILLLFICIIGYTVVRLQHKAQQHSVQRVNVQSIGENAFMIQKS